MNYSLTIKGLATFAIGWIASQASVTLEQDSLSVLVDNLILGITAFLQVAGLVLAYIGRYRRGDITWYGRKLTNR
jgi:hypothetical protein